MKWIGTAPSAIVATTLVMIIALAPLRASSAEVLTRQQASDALKRAAAFYHAKIASHGGYVYYYSLDLSQRWGEGVASPHQIWVQPPGTPTVGLAYLRAFEATGDRFYLDAATDAAEALIYGQLESGGWTNCIDFDPHGSRVARYRLENRRQNQELLGHVHAERRSCRNRLRRIDRSGFFFRNKRQRRRVDAVPQSGRLRTVREHVT